MPSIFTSELALGKSIANLCTKLVLQYWKEQQQTAESFVMLKEKNCLISSAQFMYSWNYNSIFQLNSLSF